MASSFPMTSLREHQRLTFFGASSSAGLASFDFSAPSSGDPFPNKKSNDGASAGAAGGFLPNVNAGGADDAAVEAGLSSFNPKENGDDAVDAVRGDGAGFFAFFFSSS